MRTARSNEISPAVVIIIMRYLIVIMLAATMASLASVPALRAPEDTSQQGIQDTSASQPMTIQDVIDLSKAGVSDKIIIDQMNASQSTFELSSKDIVSLKNAGVSDRVIGAMIGTTNPSRHAYGPSAGWYVYAPYPYFYPFYGGLGFYWQRFYGHHGFPYGHRGFYAGRGFHAGGFHGGFGAGGHRAFGSHR